MIFRVITETRCPCDRCCGELTTEPEVEEFASLREALCYWQNAGPEGFCDGIDCYPVGSSLRAVARDYSNDCDTVGCWECSLHLPAEMSASSQDRLITLLLARKIITSD